MPANSLVCTITTLTKELSAKYELFPSNGQGFAQAKFSKMALKMLVDHPRRTLITDDESNKHGSTIKEYQHKFLLVETLGKIKEKIFYKP